MKNLKNYILGIVLTTILILGTGTVNAGILLSDDFVSNDTNPCSETHNDSTSLNDGILVTFTGILVTYTGILVTLEDGTQVNCGILLTD
ncbi:MAG: hypothetical protein JSS81_02550 [Acidobacteria bacterium]|nr:hypothetical protein [Acidobacteriota bacterium]